MCVCVCVPLCVIAWACSHMFAWGMCACFASSSYWNWLLCDDGYPHAGPYLDGRFCSRGLPHPVDPFPSAATAQGLNHIGAPGHSAPLTMSPGVAPPKEYTPTYGNGCALLLAPNFSMPLNVSTLHRSLTLKCRLRFAGTAPDAKQVHILKCSHV